MLSGSQILILMRKWVLLFLLAVIVIAVVVIWGYANPSPVSGTRPHSFPVSDTGDIPLGRGQFVFNDSLGNSDRPITVYTYRPVAWNQSGSILFVMPGAGRSGFSPRETWIPYSEQYSALLIVTGILTGILSRGHLVSFRIYL